MEQRTGRKESTLLHGKFRGSNPNETAIFVSSFQYTNSRNGDKFVNSILMKQSTHRQDLYSHGCEYEVDSRLCCCGM
jgi:hypothetical protein